MRFQRKGVKHGRFFSDAKHDGIDGAFEAARAWRDETLREIGPTPRSDASQMHTAKARRKNRQSVSRTGVTGIGFVVRDVRVPERPLRHRLLA